MKRSLLAYNGFGTVIAILLWYGVASVGFDPALLFVGIVSGILFGSALAVKTDDWFWLPLVLMAVAMISYGVGHIVTESNSLHMFLVLGTLFLSIPISARVLGTYELHFEQMLPGTPAFLAFAWFVNLGVWWGIGAALVMFSAQLGLGYWFTLRELKQINTTPA